MLMQKGKSKAKCIFWSNLVDDFRVKKINSEIIWMFQIFPVIWMSHNKKFNNRINVRHERGLGMIYRGCNSSFQDLLNKDKSRTI